MMRSQMGARWQTDLSARTGGRCWCQVAAQVAVRTWTAYAPVQIRSISATPFALLRYSIPILIRKPLYAWDLEVGTLVMLLLCNPEC